MENSGNVQSNGINLRKNSTADDEEDEVWQDFLGIAADPPDRREKCEYCQ